MLKQCLFVALLLAIGSIPARAMMPTWLAQALMRSVTTTPMVWGALHRSELPHGVSLQQWQQTLPCEQRFEVTAGQFWLCQHQQKWWGFQQTQGALWLTEFNRAMQGNGAVESRHLSQLSAEQEGSAGLVVSLHQQSLALTEKFMRFRYAARVQLVERISEDHVLLWLSQPQQLLLLTNMQQQTLMLAFNHDA